jgi:hypothetical protein
MRADRQAPESFPIVPSTTGTVVFLAFILVVCLLPVVAMARLFAEAPAIAIAWLVPLGTGTIVSYMVWSSRHVRFELWPDGLRVRNSLFARTVPRADLLPAEGRAVSLREEPQLRPFIKTWGGGLPGYREGWFRLRNRDKALVFLTDRTRIVDLPTRKGYRILLSVADPQEFLDAARGLWGGLVPAPSVAGEDPAGLRAVPLEPR